jgi:general transcription factor 3C protein 4
MLRPFFLRLRDPVELDRLRERFLEVMRTRFPEDHSLKIKLTSWESNITPDVRVKFRVGLSTNLFGSDDLLSLRMRLSLVDVCWVLSFSSSSWMVLLTFFFFFLVRSFRN